MGDGDRAAAQLEALLARYIQPNTLYRESGPVIETPLSAAASLQELYIQYRDGRTLVFPAVPRAWKEATFIDFRTAGGFLVSALRRGGKTTYIQVKATADGTCVLQTDMELPAADERGIVELTMKKGETIILGKL
jgi:hypothetical protein